MTWHFDSRISFASTLPSSYYVDPAVLAAENRNVFARTWQLAGRSEQVRDAGMYFTATIANEPLLVVRGSDGVLRAMSNVCRHRAGPVAKGEGKRPVLQCGYHGWTYALDGSLLTTPEFDGVEEFDRRSCTLPQFRVEEWNELVFVNLDRDAPPLPDFLGDLATRLAKRDYAGYRLAARKDWFVDCNWKVYVDNYLEGYHIPIVHPSLFREIDYARYRTETRRNYSIQFAPLRNPERIRTNREDDDAEYFWLFPNLMLNVYPDNFSTNLIVPVGPSRTLTVFEWYFHNPDAPDVQKRIDETIAFSDEIQIEDIEICETVQRGLASATYTTGRYSPRRENGVHHFHQLYVDAMDCLAIRRANAHDADGIAALLADAFAEFRPRYTDGGYAATVLHPHEIERRLAEDGPSWVAVDGQRIAGTVSAMRKGDALYVRSMAVAPDVRGKGIAHRLLDAVERFAGEEGIDELQLSTTPFLDDAIRMYEAAGFIRGESGPADLFGTPLFGMTKRLSGR